MFTSLTSQIGVVAMALVCGFAVWKGGRSERIAAVSLAINWVACEALEDFDFSHKAQPVIFGIDVAYALILLVLLVDDGQAWITFAFAYQALIVLTHVAAAIDPVTTRWDFFIAYYVWSAGVLISLAAGAILAAGRRGATYEGAAAA